LAGIHLPDPTVSVEEEMPELFASESTLTALALRDDLVAVLPVLAGGAYARGIDQFLATRPRRLANHAGHALAFALKRLAERRVIGFERRSDAEQLILDDPLNDTNPTHINWIGAGT
jgi:hypothetical protein